MGAAADFIQLLEFNPAGEIVWTWSKADLISSLQGVLVLDGLDISGFHDERVGIMSLVAEVYRETQQSVSSLAAFSQIE